MENHLFFEDMREAYLACALFADWPEEYSPRSIYDSSRKTWEQALRDCQHFANLCKRAGIIITEYCPETMGHNLWLSRNGHGTGFWDTVGRTSWNDEQGEIMHDCACKLGSAYPYPLRGKYWTIE